MAARGFDILMMLKKTGSSIVSMDRGLFFSLVLHAGIVVAAVYGLPEFKREFTPPTEPVTIEIENIQKERTQVEKPAEEKAEEPQQEQKPQHAANEAQPVSADPEAMPALTKAKPVAKAKPKPRAKPKLTDRQRLVNKVRPRVKPKAPKRFNVNKLTEYIDRSIKEEKKDDIKPTKEKKAEKKKKSEPKPEPKPRAFTGLEGRLRAASIADAIRVKLQNCWNRPKGLKDSETMVVPVRLFLNTQGGLAKMPEILDSDYKDPSQPFRQVFGESVMRAITTCGSFEEAIPLLKDGIKYFDITFRPAG